MQRESLRFILAGGKVLTWKRIVRGLVYRRAWAWAWAFLRLLATGIATMDSLGSLGSLGYAKPRLGRLGMLGKDLAISQNPRDGKDETMTKRRVKGCPVISFPLQSLPCTLGLGMQRPD